MDDAYPFASYNGKGSLNDDNSKLENKIIEGYTQKPADWTFVKANSGRTVE